MKGNKKYWRTENFTEKMLSSCLARQDPSTQAFIRSLCKPLGQTSANNYSSLFISTDLKLPHL